MLLYLCLITGLLLFYFTGHVLYHTSNISVTLLYQRVFTKIGIGILVLVLMHSLIITKGVTINSVIIPILLFILFSGDYRFRFTRFRISSNFPEDRKAILPALLVLTLVFCYAYWFIMVTKNGQPSIAIGDDLFNAQAAMYFNYSGIETLNWNYLDTSTNSVSPYHYFVCWIISFLSSVFNQSTYLSVELLVNPLLYTLIIIGLWAFLEKYKITPFRQAFCILILFICGLHLNLMDHFGLFNWCYFYSNLFFTADTKLSLFYVVLLGCLLLWQNQKFKISLFVFLLLPVFSIALAPAALLTCSIILIVHAVTSDRTTLKLLFFPCITGLLILGFYRIFANDQMLSISNVSVDLRAAFSFSLKTYSYKCLAALAVYSPYVLAILALSLVNPKENLKTVFRVFYFIFVSFTVSFFVWMFLYDFFGSSEFHYYFIQPILNTALFALILYLFTESKVMARRIIISSLLLPALIFSAAKCISVHKELKENSQYKYSENYLNAVQQEVKGNLLLLAGVMNREGTFQNTGNPFVSGQFDYLSCGMTKYSSLMPLNFRYNPTNENGTKNKQIMAMFDPFTKYQSKIKSEGKFISTERSRLDFVKAHQIKYLIIKPESFLDSVFLPYIEKRITDSSSKETLIVLKY